MGLIIKNGVIYNGAESEPVVYSLDEREVGVYTDGKPLYQKTLHFTTTSSANTYISVPYNISDADIIFIHDAFVQGPSVSFILSGYRGDAAANEIIGLLNNTDNTFDYKCGASVINSDAYITLRYTKTTDTPGSGTWTPSGVKAEHYSTNEHVVGTWIGETLYEKSYHVSSLSTTYQVVDSNITSSNAKIRDCKIGGYKVGGGYQNAQYANGFVSSSIFSRVILAADGVRVGMEGSFSESITDFDFTIRYTKTTT